MSPTYRYHCACGASREILRPISQRREPTTCTCGKRMTLTVSAPALSPTRDTEGKA